MIVLDGKGVFKGIAFGKFYIDFTENAEAEKYKIEDTVAETQRYFAAKDLAIKQTREIKKRTKDTLGDSEAQIFEVHEMMMEDKDYLDCVLNIIENEKFNAEYAVWKTSQKFSKIFSDMEDTYMKSRAIDVADISKCIIGCLKGETEKFESKFEAVIMGAKDFTPSEVSSFGKKIKGFVSSGGSVCSHTAILSKVMKIPSVVALGDNLKPEYNGKYAVIDGFSGCVYIEPEETVLKSLQNKKKQHENSEILLKQLKGKENITRDGKKIKVYANINNPEEIDDVLENDPGGIGLFRSEFLYLNRLDYPSEDEQFEIYKKIVGKMDGKEVIIRTLDIGSDKRSDYFSLPQEENPAMGYRGIRVCLDRPEIFSAQLKAIYRASAYGNVSVMFPMITSLFEITEIKKHVNSVKEELASKNIPFMKDLKIGVMIETPAAVLISDDLAKEVDFFSIGTNDLTQYTLAVDRQNGKVSHMFDSHHKSVLRMIKMVVENAHKNGIWAGICGESASDETLTDAFLSLDIDELSMASPFILSTRKKIMETDVSAVKEQILKLL